jgi:hypothetical protein
LKSYADYTSKYASIVLLINDEKIENNSFGKFISKVERDPALAQQTLDSLMITPVRNKQT